MEDFQFNTSSSAAVISPPPPPPSKRKNEIATAESEEKKRQKVTYFYPQDPSLSFQLIFSCPMALQRVMEMIGKILEYVE